MNKRIKGKLLKKALSRCRMSQGWQGKTVEVSRIKPKEMKKKNQLDYNNKIPQSVYECSENYGYVLHGPANTCTKETNKLCITMSKIISRLDTNSCINILKVI